MEVNEENLGEQTQVAPGSESSPEPTPSGQSTTETPPTEVEQQETSQSSPGEQVQSTEVSPDASIPDTPQGQQMEAVDESGIPWKNRAMETQRKLDKVLTQYDTVIEKIESSTSQPQKEQYSIEELEEFVASTDNTAHKKWAQGEIRRIHKEDVANGVRTELGKSKQQEQREKSKQDALNAVMQRYPEAFQKDAQGRFVGWDNGSPLAQRIGLHMQDPEISNNPRGLLVAAALAYSDVSMNQSVQSQQKQAQLKSQVKNLQKQTLVEGGGVNSPPKPASSVNAAKQKLASTGSVKDGQAVFKEVLKQRGRIRET